MACIFAVYKYVKRMSYKSRFSRLSAGAKCPMFRAYSCSVSGVSKLPDAISLAVCSAGGMYSGCSSLFPAFRVALPAQ